MYQEIFLLAVWQNAAIVLLISMALVSLSFEIEEAF